MCNESAGNIQHKKKPFKFDNKRRANYTAVAKSHFAMHSKITRIATCLWQKSNWLLLTLQEIFWGWLYVFKRLSGSNCPHYIILYQFFAYRIPSNGRICAKQGSLMIFFHSSVAPAILIQLIFNWNFLTGSAMSNYFTIKNVFQSNVKEIFKSLINEGQ